VVTILSYQTSLIRKQRSVRSIRKGVAFPGVRGTTEEKTRAFSIVPGCENYRKKMVCVLFIAPMSRDTKFQDVKNIYKKGDAP